METLEQKYKRLNKRSEQLQQNHTKVKTELEFRKRSLKSIMDECINAGFDPNTLEEEIKKKEEVLQIKLNNYESDLDIAEKQLEPMLKEIG